jgi:large subunit ribosomal protein L43
MVSRGVPQLKNIRLYFCDFGGSSLGVRNTLQSPQLVNFVAENPHLQIEISMRRNFHPYISSTYINGYVKDQSLKNMKEDEILEWLTKVNSEFGRRPLKHNSVKVVSG